MTDAGTIRITARTLDLAREASPPPPLARPLLAGQHDPPVGDEADHPAHPASISPISRAPVTTARSSGESAKAAA